ncbi:uncharacterized protein LOC141534407 [Cotesia typhae]|uniref:uncharacterized protein LOC141534407 n=1 Tax=Cotesia typhae TaxID=2053667 RepID=UPI003D69FDE2
MSEKETMLLKLLFTTIIEVSLVHAYLGETRESSSDYECRYYSELCNPDYFLPCCKENHVCIMIESLSEYYCMNHAGLGMKCREDYDCYDNYSVCSEDNQKCTCDKNYIERDGSCQPIIGGNCDGFIFLNIKIKLFTVL